MIRTIFFDFGGVISGNHNSWDGMHKRIKDETGLTADALDTIFQKHWPDISVDKKSYTVFLEDLAQHSKKKITAKQLLQMFDEDTQIDQEVTTIIKELKQKGFRVALLSNEAKLGEEFRLKKVANFFDKTYSSATVGIRKPDPKIFEHALKAEKIKSDEALFIDDKERNTIIAEELGIRSILFKNAKQLRDDLQKYLQ